MNIAYTRIKIKRKINLKKMLFMLYSGQAFWIMKA